MTQWKIERDEACKKKIESTTFAIKYQHQANIAGDRRYNMTKLTGRISWVRYAHFENQRRMSKI